MNIWICRKDSKLLVWIAVLINLSSWCGHLRGTEELTPYSGTWLGKCTQGLMCGSGDIDGGSEAGGRWISDAPFATTWSNGPTTNGHLSAPYADNASDSNKGHGVKCVRSLHGVKCVRRLLRCSAGSRMMVRDQDDLDQEMAKRKSPGHSPWV